MAARMRATPWVVLDCVAAAVLVALSARGAALRSANFALSAPIAVGVAVLAAGPVAVRRLWPAAVFAVALAANSVAAAVGVSGDPAIAVALALYSIAVSRPPR